jgi:hypothetical protein
LYMGYLVYIGTVFVGVILLGIGFAAVEYAHRGGPERRLVGILGCLLVGGAAIAMGYWEVFVGRNDEFNNYTYPVIGWICLLGGILATIVFVLMAASGKNFDEQDNTEKKPLAQLGEYRATSLPVQSQPQLNLQCAEHPQNDAIGKCNYCWKPVCQSCLTIAADKAKESQNTTIIITAATADRVCPSCVAKWVAGGIEKMPTSVPRDISWTPDASKVVIENLRNEKLTPAQSFDDASEEM